ncbi:MAG: TraR/DksA family transcriptional regulator [Bacteriovoracia bacterium]
MKKDVLRRFKKLFEEQKANVLYNDKVLRDDFQVNTDDRLDDVDQASSEMEQSLRMRLRNREMLLIKKIDEALKRIDKGTFGVCESCENDIEIKRLEARPTATLCIACKEDEERREIHTADGRKSKSLGVALTRFS